MSIFKKIKSLLTPPEGLENPANYYKDLSYVVMLGSSQPLLGAIAIIIVKQILEGDNQQVALIQAGSMAGLLLSLFFTRYLAGSKPQTSYALPQVLGWLAIIGCGLVSSSMSFSLLVFFTLTMFHISSPCQGLLYQQIYPAKLRGRTIAKVKQWQLLVALSLSWLLGHMIETSPYSYPPAYWISGVLGLLACLLFMTIQTREHQQRKENHGSFQDYLRILTGNRHFFLFMLFQFILGVANLSGLAVFQVFINDSQYLGLSPEEAALVAGILPPLAMFMSVQLWGRIFDGMNIVVYRAITSAVIGLGFLIYPLFGFWGAILGSIIWGVGRGGGQLAWSIGVLDFAPEGQASAYLSIHTFLTGVRGVVAPFLGIWLIDTKMQPETLFYGVALLIFLSAALTLAFVKVPNRSQD